MQTATATQPVVPSPPPPTSYEALDALLAGHPFGDSDYINKQLHICFNRRLHKIAARLPSAQQLLDALAQADDDSRYRAIGDTVVRCAIQHALTQVETGKPYGLPLTQCEDVFLETARLLARGTPAPLGHTLDNRIGPARWHGWIWSDARSDDLFGRTMRDLVQGNYGERLAVTGADETAMLKKGVDLLAELLPQSSRSALAHTHLIGLFPAAGNWATRASSSEFTLCGTVFLSVKLLANPWWVAEHLYHEALHQQLYDFRHGHTLLHPDFERQGAPTICSLWNRPDGHRGNYWDIHRALAAFHVYVHLAVLAAAAERRAPQLEAAYGPIRLNTGSRTAFVRAHYLGQQIRATCWQELGAAGKRLVDWFGSVLETIDLPAPPPDAYVHLLLDRYWKEAMEVELLTMNTVPADALAHPLKALLDNEVDSARRALAGLDSQACLGRFEQALQASVEADPAERFVQVRRLIARTLIDAAPDGYRLAASQAPDRIVRDMVEHSSESLVTLLAR